MLTPIRGLLLTRNVEVEITLNNAQTHLPLPFWLRWSPYGA